MNKEIGYFIPEFPGQTHTWIWREYQALLDIGMKPHMISTKYPPTQVVHTWAQKAQSMTDYLVPFETKDFVNIPIELIKAGPIAWWRCLSVIANTKNISFSQKLYYLVLVVMGAKLVSLAKTQGWSHVHVHSCGSAANIALFASILSDITYSLALLGQLEDFGANQEQKWKYSAFASVMSEQLFNSVKDELAGFLPKDVKVSPVGVNLDEIKRETPYIPWQEGSPCRIYTCGRLNIAKGQKYLIESVKLLRERGFDVRLQIAGEDSESGNGYRKELEKFIQEQSMSDYVELLGSVSEERNRQGYKEADIFALPSLKEGISVAVMEAMAMETPVVVTQVGGMAELIDSGVDGMLVPAENPEIMADVIAKLLQNKELTLSLTQKSRQKIAAKFHHRRSAQILLESLEELQ
ncbi:exopolysaccharide biosynthesis GT4 family glycosyltransferase EpsE [Tychonema sp. BBK16]|uniref:exopolysaccharide biosynthesis GT4 family glycosyltransferase EpsE n=1 Tax=Tychonema sp. BBK16 TaxID=2699888 RepID=UPI001F283F69|nr:exopolysaccharide biosynthesis GT4 family glycosyltransferase EpsE [Tychonema sp. BBK16]MCF6374714.1 glycosyltransferase family 4 protein [Tychonema sp. BBK16]